MHTHIKYSKAHLNQIAKNQWKREILKEARGRKIHITKKGTTIKKYYRLLSRNMQTQSNIIISLKCWSKRQSQKPVSLDSISREKSLKMKV